MKSTIILLNLSAIVLAVTCVSTTFCSHVAAQPSEGEAVTASLERVGDVGGRTFDEQRSSFDVRGASFITEVDAAVRVWDANTLRPLTKPLVHGEIKGFVISGDGRTVLTRDEAEARVWDVATSAVRCVVRPAQGKLAFAEVSPDGTRVLTVSEGDALHVHLWRIGKGDAELEKRLVHRGEGTVISAQFDPTGTRVVTYRDWTGSFMIHNPDDRFALGSPFKTDKEYSYPYVAKLDPRGGQLAIPKERDLLIVDCRTGTRTITSRFANDGTYPHDVFFSADGSRISVVIRVGGFKVECQSYDADTGKFQCAFATGMRNCRLFGPRGRLAVCDDYVTDIPNRAAELWDVEAGKLLQAIPGEWLREASPDGKTVLFETPAKRTSVWRLRG